MKHIGLVRSRVNRRSIRYGVKTVSCKQKVNPCTGKKDNSTLQKFHGGKVTDKGLNDLIKSQRTLRIEQLRKQSFSCVRDMCER